MSINRVNITGNLTRDPNLRTTQSGMSVLDLGIAVNDRRKNNQTGEWEDYPNYVDCTVFGKRADSLERILVKGMKVAIEGKLRYNQWEKDGQKRSKLTVIVDEIDLMQSKAGNGGSTPPNTSNYGNGAQNGSQQGSQQPTSYDQSIYDDDIPF